MQRQLSWSVNQKSLIQAPESADHFSAPNKAARDSVIARKENPLA